MIFHRLSTVLRTAAHLRELEDSIAELFALQGVLDAKFRKLAGRVYATESRPGVPDQGGTPVTSKASALPGFCENYQQGQLNGPASQEAQCACAYCEEMRARRRATKSALLPAARAATLGKPK